LALVYKLFPMEHINPIEKKYNIQEVAELLGIYKGTIKNYEKKRIFPEPKRNPINGYREYTEKDIELLRGIITGSMERR